MISKLKVRLRIPFLKTALNAPQWLLNRIDLGLATNEGEPLEQKLRWFLKLQSLDPIAHMARDVNVERDAFRAIGDSHLSGDRIAVRTENAVISGSSPIEIRIYRPLETMEDLPAILWLHGGGWVIGDLDTHDRFCRRLCRDTHSIVIAVDYRRAPEVVFPTPLDDITRVWRWLKKETEYLGIDPCRIALGGDSAGGNMTAVLCHELSPDEKPCLQILCYPSTDMANRHPSRDKFKDGFLLNEDMIQWFTRQYVGGADPRDPRLSPLLNTSFTEQPPAILVTAGLDPLCDEGLAYSERLSKVTAVTHLHEPTQVHGFITLTGALSDAEKAVQKLCVAIRSQLHA